MTDIIGDPGLVRMLEKFTELVKKQDRLNRRVNYLAKCIAEHPQRVREYLDEKAKGSWQSQFMWDPRKPLP